MTHGALENLTRREFLAGFDYISNPDALRSALQKSTEVKKLRNALRNEEITEISIRQFVSNLLDQLERGVLFPYNISLAAIAVALERWVSDFSEEYIIDLARLEREELRKAAHVARKSAEALNNRPDNKSKEFILAEGNEDMEIREGREFLETASEIQDKRIEMEIP